MSETTPIDLDALEALLAQSERLAPGEWEIGGGDSETTVYTHKAGVLLFRRPKPGARVHLALAVALRNEATRLIGIARAARMLVDAQDEDSAIRPDIAYRNLRGYFR